MASFSGLLSNVSQIAGVVTSAQNLYDQLHPTPSVLSNRQLDSFTAKVNDVKRGLGGFARPNYFLATIEHQGPKLSSPLLNHQNQARINLLCDSTTLPDIATIPITSSEGTDFPYDIVNNFAYATHSATFYLSSDMWEKKFFDKWIELTYHKEKGQPNFYNNYTASMKITQGYFGGDGSSDGKTARTWTHDTENPDKKYTVTLKDVYPKSIAPISLDWSSTNTLAKMSVTFHYSSWSSNYSKVLGEAWPKDD
jgi:hypothetical protein